MKIIVTFEQVDALAKVVVEKMLGIDSIAGIEYRHQVKQCVDMCEKALVALGANVSDVMKEDIEICVVYAISHYDDVYYE